MQDKPKKWMKLDNAAKIYPAAKSRSWTALFRLSAELADPIDPKLLAQAQANTLKRFVGFAQILRHGFFWYYLEHQEGAPDVQPDVGNPCVRMNLKENRRFMFRVRYHENRIAVEIFHVLTDGTGGLCFLKTLVAEYIELRYGVKIARGGDILDCTQPPQPGELEDSYLRFARSATRSRSEQRAYHLHGPLEERHYMNIVTGILPADQVLACAKRYDATVTELFTALLIMSVYQIQQKELGRGQRRRPVKVNVPINLRNYYDSHTLRNFASYVNPGIEPKYGVYTFEETLKIVHHYLQLETTEKLLNAKITTNVQTERNRLMRAVPLFIKNPVMKAAFLKNGDKQSSTSISNLGVTQLPGEMARYVTRMDFMLGPLSRTRVACACITYQNSMVVNFTRTLKSAEVERGFFTALVKLGIPVYLESNQRY